MKKLIFGLLLVAAAGAAFLILQKNNKPLQNSFEQEQLIGQWSLVDLQPGRDSNSMGQLLYFLLDSGIYHAGYEFKENGTITISSPDSPSPDTAHWAWDKDRRLVFKDHITDSTSEIMQVAVLNKDSLRLVGIDSALLIFSRTKQDAR